MKFILEIYFFYYFFVIFLIEKIIYFLLKFVGIAWLIQPEW
jgi:hypothetical protein